MSLVPLRACRSYRSKTITKLTAENQILPRLKSKHVRMNPGALKLISMRKSDRLLARIFHARADVKSVAQTSKSAVSQVSRPACRPLIESPTDTPRIWKPAIRQVGKPALRVRSNLSPFVGEMCGPGCVSGQFLMPQEWGWYARCFQGVYENNFSSTGMGFPVFLLWGVRHHRRRADLLHDSVWRRSELAE